MAIDPNRQSRRRVVRAWLDRTPESWAPPTDADLAGPFRFLLWLARSQARRIAAASVLGTCWMLGLTVPPWILSRAVDDGLVAGDPGALVRWALALAGVSVLVALLGIARHRTMTKIRMDASFRSVRATVRHTARLGASLERRVSAGEVVTVGIADVQTVAQALTVTGPGVGAVVAYTAVAAVLFAIEPVLAAVVLAGVPLLALAVGPFLHRIERTGGEYRIHQGRLTGRLVDVLSGLGVLNGLGGKQLVAERYEQQSQRLVTHGYRVAGPSSGVGALATGLPAVFLAVVVWLSARLAVAGTITIGEVVAVHGFVAVLVLPVAALIEAGGDLARARVAGRRIIDLLNLPTPPRDEHDAVTLPAGCGPLVDPASGAIIRAGLLTALVSSRPSGAVAVAQRLGGVAMDDEAPVVWCGVPIDEVPQGEFRRRLVLADNGAHLFAESVREVVAGRLEADDDQVRAALHVAVAEDIVEALPDGLATTVAAGGSDLSGGQRQRIRLARAVCADPDVLVAVDPTSAVDANTEAAMIDRLRAARRGRTTVVTTTSPLVLDRADEVIVLDDGAVSAVGTHADLLAANVDYRRVVARAQGSTQQEHRAGPPAGEVGDS